MNRSFVYGIIVASTTWCVSLYLYWMLVHSTPDLQPSSMTASHLNAPSIGDTKLNQNLVRPNQNQILAPDDGKRAYVENQKSYIYQKYKKEKKFRKISQRLIDELKPVQIDAGKGECFRCPSTHAITHCSTLCSQMNSAWLGMQRNSIYETLATNGMRSTYWWAARSVWFETFPIHGTNCTLTHWATFPARISIQWLHLFRSQMSAAKIRHQSVANGVCCNLFLQRTHHNATTICEDGVGANAIVAVEGDRAGRWLQRHRWLEAAARNGD